MFGYGQTVIIHPPAGKDRYGDPISTPDAYSVGNVGIAWDSTSEDTDRRNSAISEIRLLLPPGTPIEANSKVVLPDGDTYLMVGKPSRPHSPITGWEPGVTARFKAVTT